MSISRDIFGWGCQARISRPICSSMYEGGRTWSHVVPFEKKVNVSCVALGLTQERWTDRRQPLCQDNSAQSQVLLRTYTVMIIVFSHTNNHVFMTNLFKYTYNFVVITIVYRCSFIHIKPCYYKYIIMFNDTCNFVIILPLLASIDFT